MAKLHPKLMTTITLQNYSEVSGISCRLIANECSLAIELWHLNHLKTLQAARQLYHWLRMKLDVTSVVERCKACQRMRPSQCRENLQPTAEKFPMETVSANLFEFHTHHYLVMVDRYSGCSGIHQLCRLHTEAKTSALHNCFLQYGFPMTIRNDVSEPGVPETLLQAQHSRRTDLSA